MPDPIVTPPASQGDPPAAGEPGTPVNGPVGGEIPEGFVPRSEFEKEQARSRAFQAEKDRLAAQLAAANPAPPAGDPPTPLGFDPDEFRRTLMRDVTGAARLVRLAETLRGQYPDADSGLFDRSHEFASPEAFQLAVMESHDRVSSVRGDERAKTETRIRAEYAASGFGPPTPPTGGNTPTDGDPTPEAFARMSDAEWNALEAKSPGLIKRVLSAAA